MSKQKYILTPRKTLVWYVEKYGIVSGTRRFNGVQKGELAKKQKYAKQPFGRLSKEWYIWRYGEFEGTTRFDSFVGKCTQNLDNFIKRHGEKEGVRMHQQCMSKKNTIKLAREKHGEDFVKARCAKIGASKRGRKCSEQARENMRAGQRKANLVSKKDRFIKKYGEKEGLEKYLEHKKKVYAGPNRATQPVLDIISILEKRLSKEAFDDLYFGARGRNEYWLRDRDTNKLFFYDIVDPKARLIIEYDGAFWHPRDGSLDPNKKVGMELHPVTKIPLRKMMWDDSYKKAVADENNFYLFLIHENDSLDRQEMKIDWFCSRALSYNRRAECF